MLNCPRTIGIACQHAGLARFDGLHYYHAIVRLLQLFRLPHPSLGHSRHQLCRIARIHGAFAASYFSATSGDVPSTYLG
jgi:hypothetical protein